MKRLVVLAFLMCIPFLAGAQDFKKYLDQVDEYPFIVISKPALTLDLVDENGKGPIRLTNDDITDLKQRVQVGTPVIILPDVRQPSNS